MNSNIEDHFLQLQVFHYPVDDRTPGSADIPPDDSDPDDSDPVDKSQLEASDQTLEDGDSDIQTEDSSDAPEDDSDQTLEDDDSDFQSEDSSDAPEDDSDQTQEDDNSDFQTEVSSDEPEKDSDEPAQPVNVTISANAMEAYAMIRVNGDVPISSILAALSTSGVIIGVDEEAVDHLANADGPRGYPHLVAKGEKPQPGTNATLELFFDGHPQPKISYDEQGHADYKEVGIIQQVKEGDLLAKKTPAMRGKSGMTVTGIEQPGFAGRDLDLTVGMGTRIDESGLQIFAAQSGAAALHPRNEISVSDEYVVEGDVDFESGNVRFDGAVRVLGSVIGGFSVHASGDVEVRGVVEDATIHCGGNLHIRGGFLGRGKGVAKVCGETHIRFLENQTVICQGDVHIAEEIIFGNVVSGGEVQVRYGKGAIIGGMVSAVKGICVKTAGNMHNQKTILIAGLDEHANMLLERTTALSGHRQNTKDIVQSALDDLVTKKYDPTCAMTDEESEALDVLYRHMAGIDGWADEIAAMREQVQDQLTTLENDAFVLIQQRIHPGVKITIGNRSRSIDEEIPRAEFKLRDDQIISRSVEA